MCAATDCRRCSITNSNSISNGSQPSAAPTRRSLHLPTRFRRATSAATTNATAGWASSSRRGPVLIERGRFRPVTHVNHRDEKTGRLETVDTMQVPEALGHLYAHLVGHRCIVQLTDYNAKYLNIYSLDVL